MRGDLEKTKRKVETELSDVKEQLNEKKLHLDELSKTIVKREDELTAALTRCDEEAVARAQVSVDTIGCWWFCIDCIEAQITPHGLSIYKTKRYSSTVCVQKRPS